MRKVMQTFRAGGAFPFVEALPSMVDISIKREKNKVNSAILFRIGFYKEFNRPLAGLAGQVVSDQRTVKPFSKVKGTVS